MNGMNTQRLLFVVRKRSRELKANQNKKPALAVPFRSHCGGALWDRPASSRPGHFGVRAASRR